MMIIMVFAMIISSFISIIGFRVIGVISMIDGDYYHHINSYRNDSNVMIVLIVISFVKKFRNLESVLQYSRVHIRRGNPQ